MENAESQLTELMRLRKERALERFLQADRDLISATDAAALIANEVQTGPTGELDIASAQAALQRLKETRPYMCRSSRQDHGLGLDGVPPQRQPSDTELAKSLFGRNADSSASNRLAQADKGEWRRLRDVARRLGITA